MPRTEPEYIRSETLDEVATEINGICAILDLTSREAGSITGRQPQHDSVLASQVQCVLIDCRERLHNCLDRLEKFQSETSAVDASDIREAGHA